MRFLLIASVRPGEMTPENLSDLRRAENLRVLDLHRQRFFRAVYARADMPGAVAEIECDDVERARATLETLPFAMAGILEMQLIPLAEFPGIDFHP